MFARTVPNFSNDLLEPRVLSCFRNPSIEAFTWASEASAVPVVILRSIATTARAPDRR